MVFGILMTALGLGAICALLYYCAVFALPVFIGLSVVLWALNAGAGTSSILVGFAAGVIVFVTGQFVLSRSRSLAVRWTVMLLFALPAAITGYGMVLQLSAVGIPSLVWRHAMAVIGTVLIGFTAFAQLEKSSDESASRLRPSS